MSTFDHVSRQSLSALANETATSSESSRIRRHLILCPDCRALATPPGLNRLREVLLLLPDSNDADRRVADVEKEISVGKRFGFRWELLWAGSGTLAFLVLLSIALIRVGWTTFPSVARLDGQKTLGASEIHPPGEVVSLPKDRNGNEHRSKRSSPVTKEAKPLRSSKSVERPDLRGFSSTRGAEGSESNPCMQDPNDSGVMPDKTGEVVIRWPRVRDSVRWHLFVSDENEVLVDEFESDQAISYSLKSKPIEGKKYFWRILYTMADGSSSVGTSGTFDSRTVLTVNKKAPAGSATQKRCSK